MWKCIIMVLTFGIVGLSACGVTETPACAAGGKFGRAFAPQEGLVSPDETATRQEICLNGSWRFQGTTDLSVPGAEAPGVGAWDATAIKIPSPWNVNTFAMEEGVQGGDFRTFPSYPKAWEKVKAAWMQKTVTIPAEWAAKRLVLHFGAVAGKMVVFVNGQRAGEGFELFFAQDFDVTGLIRPGMENQILVKVIASKVFDQPGRYGRREYLSGSFWATSMAGIWQDVFLEARPEISVSDVFVQPWVDRGQLVVEATVVNQGMRAANVSVSGKVREWINLAGKSVLDTPEVRWKLADKEDVSLPEQAVALQAGESRKVTLTARVDGQLKLWSPEAPNLYGLLLTLSADGKAIDTKYQRFGWRQFSLEKSTLRLNGRPIVLRGDSWHFMGVPQMTRRYAYAWYQLVKDAGANAVRLHASIYPSFYHDMADEMGIMILDESAIWLSDGGPKSDSDVFWRNCRANVEDLVRRDRNHPSVFGWSVCNEALPVLRNVWHTPQSMVNHCLDEMTAWVGICRTNDPTRGWISGDGEWDAEGRMPTINIHYGSEGDMKRAADSGKPWAVGETSMAYYGTPKQVSKFNGDRAYESDLGRMEGLAYECYALLRNQQKYGASYQSVFNLAWYATQPLPLGQADQTRPYRLTDGVFFGAYCEGAPGMQPERLGPYCSTLNPGYDPALPMYRPWPMFEAIRDANTGKADSKWASLPKPAGPATLAATRPEATSATLLYLPANGKKLVDELNKVGVRTAPFVADTKMHQHLVLDGSDAASLDDAATRAATGVLAAGGTVWIWNITPDGAKAVGALLGQQVLAEPREASSFVVKAKTPLLAGLDNAGLYFSESDDWLQMANGLGGGFVEKADVLLDACPADWRMWNYQGETVKTAALFRSEVERPAPRAAIVNRQVGAGRVILCNISPAVKSPKKRDVVAQLMRNEGIGVGNAVAQNAFLDGNGRLVKALVAGSFGVDNLKDAYGESLDVGKIKEGVALHGMKWAARAATAQGVFDFKKYALEGPQTNAVAYVAVWIKSPRPLNDLLSEPDQPKVSFTYGSDDGCQVWLNGKRLASHERTGPLEPEAFTINPLLLTLGWNQLAIKVVQVDGEWQFAGKFGCTDIGFLQKLEFATEEPLGQGK